MEQNPQTEILEILKDVQKRIGYLEKKIDALSEGSTRRSSNSRSYSSSRGASTQNSRSYADSRGARSTGGSSRYKDKHESAFGAKKEGVPKWYDQKKGIDEKSVPKNKKKIYKSSAKKRA